jgi:hypothetical protein
MTMGPPNNLKQKRDSKKYKVSRITTGDYKKAEERWETEDIQKEMDEAEPVDIENIPMIYGDERPDQNVEDPHNNMSYEPGQLGGKRRKTNKRKMRKNKSHRGRSYRKSRSNKTHNTRRGKHNKKTKTIKRRRSRGKK